MPTWKPKQPDPPDEMTNDQFGDLVGWGRGPQGAIDRLGNVTAEDVAEIRQNGVTPQKAREWADFYDKVWNYMGKKGLQTPEVRAKLMHKIADMMGSP